MKTITIDSISISPTRQRRAFDVSRLQELSDGISKRGLLHPIILREEEGNFSLVCGERRLRAIKDLHELGLPFQHDGQDVPAGHIPYTLLSDLTPLAAEEAELEENILRDDLTWQERAQAVTHLMSLRTLQAIEKGLAKPTTADIALEVRGSSAGVNQSATRKEIIVAKYLDVPGVAAAKTVDEAYKFLARKEQRDKHAALAVKVGRTFSAEMHKLFHTDCLSWMREAPAESVDVILTDPPYGMGADSFGDAGGMVSGEHAYDDSLENWEILMATLSAESYRLAKREAHLYMFLDIENFPAAKKLFTAAGWKVFRTPLIWYKRLAIRAPWPDQGPRRTYETILYAVKGNKTTLRLAGDVLDIASDDNLGHAAQKPVALYKELLSRSVMPGDVVLDPFAGSGTVFAAAHSLSAKAIGIEVDAAYYGIALSRLENLKNSTKG